MTNPIVRGYSPRATGSPSSHKARGSTSWLSCGLYGTEWLFHRIRCPSCGEEEAAKLPAFQGGAHAGVRIESCETCRRYVKSIDLTLDAPPLRPPPFQMHQGLF